MRIQSILFVLLLGARVVCAQPPMAGNCTVFPADNIWNTPIDTLPVSPSSANYINRIGATVGVHADFGSGTWDGGPIGIPFVKVPGTQPKYPATFLYYDESDAGPYAVPLDAPIEGGSNSTGDRHAIAVDTDNCILYELYRAFPQTASWNADSGAIFRPEFARLAAGDLDFRGRRRAAHHARAGALRRGGVRRDPACAAFHRAAHPARLCLAGAPLRIHADRPHLSAHGTTVPLEGEFRHLGLSRRRAGDSARAEEVRNDAQR